MKLPCITRSFVCLLVAFPLGCTSWDHTDLFPDTDLSTLNTTVNFSQILESPDTHQGDTLMLGGEVLEAKRLKDHTRLTILQLPLDTYQEPTRDRTKSEGRFLAIQPKFLDPATVPKGTRLTLIGTLSGRTTEPLDETDYTYPTLTLHQLKVWPDRIPYPYAYHPHGYWQYGPYPSLYYGTRIRPYGYYPLWWYD